MAKKSSDEKLKDVLQKINEQMYERNVELTVKNRTLSVLRDLYEIINTTLGVEETAEQLVHVITHQMKFRGGSIVLWNKSTHRLEVAATASANKKPQKKNIPLIKKFNTLSFSKRLKKNKLVDAFKEEKRIVTKQLHDVVNPEIPLEKAIAMQKQLKIETLVLYPIMFGGKPLGVLAIGMDKLVKDLTRAEKETLKEIIDVVGIAIQQASTYASLKEANRKLKELDQMKDDFVSVASHELRTPMTAIKSYLWMALSGKGGKLTKKQRYYLQRSYNSTDRLIKLVNDMLNISRIESGRMSIEMQKVHMDKLVHEVIEEVKPRADELELKVMLNDQDIPTEVRKAGKEASAPGSGSGSESEGESAPGSGSGSGSGGGSGSESEGESSQDGAVTEVPDVVADPDKIKEVLLNLIGNSLKFTEPGGTITVHFTIERKGGRSGKSGGSVKGGGSDGRVKGGDKLVTHVTDTGRGIDDKDLSTLFTKFGMVEGSYKTNKKAAGTGLGLYISKQIIELHNGEIRVFSEGLGKGATFSFTLPIYSKKVFKKMQKSSRKGDVGIVHTSV